LVKLACLWAFAALVLIFVGGVWIDVVWWNADALRVGLSQGRFEIVFDYRWRGYPSRWKFHYGWINRVGPLLWQSDVHGRFGWHIAVPVWQVLLSVGAVTAAAWRLDVIAAGRLRKGMCRKCGYDLAGIAEGAKCPECGAKA
jgi:hypothetical protein